LLACWLAGEYSRELLSAAGRDLDRRAVGPPGHQTILEM
jgi:hypothetical protein